MAPYAAVLLLTVGLAVAVYRWTRRAEVRPRGREEAAGSRPALDGATQEPALTTAPAGTGPGQMTASDRDGVTGLLDFRHLQDRLAALRSDQPATPCLTLLTIDVEGWEGTDAPGPDPQEDRALVEVAHTVKSILRSGDTCVRGEGGHLMAVLPGLDPETSGTLVTRVRHAVESLTLVTHCGGEIHLGVTVGRAFMPEDGENLDALIEAARRDMEQGRAAPRGGQTAGERLTRAVPLVSN